jgi:hypothetical protein
LSDEQIAGMTILKVIKEREVDDDEKWVK